MPKTTTDKHRLAYIPYRCSQDTYETIQKIAEGSGKPMVEVLRQLVDTGLVTTGYKQGEEYLTKQVRETVAAALKPQVERLASISAKAAQISGAAFFMSCYTGQLMLPDRERELVRGVAAEARRLGIDFLKLKEGQDMDAFIQGGVGKVLGKE